MDVTDSEAIHASFPVVSMPAREALSAGTARPTAGKEHVPARSEPKEVQPALAEQIAAALDEFASAVNVRLAFLVDQATGKTVIKVIDQETKETIRQIPPEEMLRLVARMNHLLGVLLNHQA